MAEENLVPERKKSELELRLEREGWEFLGNELIVDKD